MCDLEKGLGMNGDNSNDSLQNEKARKAYISMEYFNLGSTLK